MIGRWALAGMMVLGAVTAAVAAEKPRVPPGRDPGGVAIAIIGPGVDYTQARVAKRLARDGEGEIVGFDLIDGDRRPYAVDVAEIESAAHHRFVLHLLEPQVPSRLAVFRANSDDRLSLAQAISLVAKTPARIVFLAGGFPESPVPDFEFLAAASKQFPELLFIVPAGDQAEKLDAPGRETLPNAVVVSASGSGSDVPALFPQTGAYPGKPNQGTGVDLATSGNHAWARCKGTDCETAGGNTSQIAAARVAGLAARLSAENAALGGASLKAAIVALAKSDVAEAEVKTRYGVIEKTGPDFRVK